MTGLKWWQTAVFYQIYPRSFADGNGDGTGDLYGAIERLDYLKELGVGAIWLSPHFPSPQFDCGYDVADYTAVAPEYGTMDTFDTFLEEAHRRDLHVILDLVMNHTSDQHAWFQESRSSRTNPRRDWYIWRDGTPEQPPNNWYSSFGGSAWEYDERTDQCYYHLFFKQQPDLNWRNPDVQQAMFGAARFWLDRGVDGFRIDAVDTLFEHPGLPDHDVPFSQAELIKRFHRAENAAERRAVGNLIGRMFRHQHDHPGMHEVMQALRSVVDEYPDRMLVGETDDLAYCGNGSNELDMVFNFQLGGRKRISAASVRSNQRKRLPNVPPGAWPCNTLGNHDVSRVWSAFADGKHDAEIARANLALVLTLPGTPFLYNGEEIGMTDLYLTDLSQFRDVVGLWVYEVQTQVLEAPHEKALDVAARETRDRARTPMQWKNAPNAGFCPADVQPWLPVNPNYAAGVNAEDQQADPQSLYHAYRRLLNLRQSTPALLDGDFTVLDERSRDVLAFQRRSLSTGQVCLVAINLSARKQALELPVSEGKGRCLYSTDCKENQVVGGARVPLAPYEVLVVEWF